MQMSAVIKTSCCAACINKLEGDSFSAHLTSCLRNLEVEFDAMRRHRDELQNEVDELRVLESERNQVSDSVERLSNELSQLRIENREMRAREERAQAEYKKSYVPRADFDKLVNDHKRLLHDLEDYECKDRLFSDVSLRAAKAENRVAKLEEELTTYMTKYETNEQALKEKEALYRSSKDKIVDLTSKLQTLEFEVNNLRSTNTNTAAIQSEYTDLKTKYEICSSKLKEATSKIDNQTNLIEYLSTQLGEKSHSLIELDRTMQKNAQLESMIEASHAELYDREQLLLQRDHTIEKLSQQLQTLKEELHTNKLQADTNALRTSHEESIRTEKMKQLEKELADLKEKYSTMSTAFSTLEQERDMLKKKDMNVHDDLERLQTKYAAVVSELEIMKADYANMKGESGKSAKELERLVAALKKELGAEQMANKRLSEEYSDCKADKDTAIAVYKKLQNRYALVKQEWEKVREDNNELKREGSDLGKLREEKRELEKKLLISDENNKNLQNEINNTKQALDNMKRELEHIKLESSASADGIIGEARRLRQENNALRADLAQVMSSFDKLKLLAEHYKAKLAEYEDSTSANHTCAKGKRCPCKTRPPPPSKWKN